MRRPCNRYLLGVLATLACAVDVVSDPAYIIVQLGVEVNTQIHRKTLRQNRLAPPAHWPCYHSPGGTTMWQVCFAVFVIPTAVITALAIVEILVYGGDL